MRRSRSGSPANPSPERRGVLGNVVGGFVAGLYSVPEGIGYASLAGIGPMLGIFSGMVPVAAAAAAVGSVLMMSTLTSAIALTIGGIFEETSFSADEIPQAVVTMSLLAGVLMLVLGLLGLGKVVNFVSNAVMTGFVMGVAILIMVGKFGEIVGYDPDGFDNKLVSAADVVIHPGRWDATTAAVGLGTIGSAFALKAIPALERYALVAVVALGTAVVWIAGLDTEVISDTATIDSGLNALPIPDSLEVLPDLSMTPQLAMGAVAIAVVALAQGAGIRHAFPNPDGSRASASRDFLGQGVGNIAGAFFQAAPTGGSLSRTAVSADGGASSRLAGLIAAASVIVLVVAFGPVVGRIPEAVIGGLLFVIGVELVLGRLPDVRLVWHAGGRATTLFVSTLALTLVVPLQWAIVAGVVLSLFAYIAASSRSARLRRLTRDDQGWMLVDDVPAMLPGDEPLLLRYTGPDFFAVVSSIGEQLPDPDPADPGVLVLDLGEQRHYSSTMLKHLRDYVEKLEDAGSAFVLVQVDDDQRAVLDRAGLTELIGADNLLPDDPHIDTVLERGLRRAADLAEIQRSPNSRET